MTNISRYILGQLLWWVLLVTITLTSVVWLTQSLRFVNLIVSRGISVPHFAWLTALLLPTFLLVILPIAGLTAVLFTYNKLIADRELVVLRGAGLSHWALARPALMLGTLLMMGCYVLSVYLVPASFREFKDLQRKYRSTYSSVLLQAGVFNTVMKGVTVFIRERSGGGELLGIIVHDSRNPKRPVTMMAQRGAIQANERGPRVLMENGNRQEVREKDGQLTLLNFDRYVFDLVENKSEITGALWRDPNERYIDELFAGPGKSFGQKMHSRYFVEAHYRLSAPVLGFSLVLISVAFLLGGEFSRRGQWRRILAASAAALAVEAALIGVKNASISSVQLSYLMYATALIPVIVGSYVIAGLPWRPRLSKPSVPTEIG